MRASLSRALALVAAAALLLAATGAEARRLATEGGGGAAANAAKPAANAAPKAAAAPELYADAAEPPVIDAQDTSTDPGFPRTRNVYVQFKVAHPASYMSADGRGAKLAELVRQAVGAAPGQLRVSVAPVEATIPGAVDAPVPVAGARVGEPASVTYGAVVFNDEAGAAEREVAAVVAPGALGRLASGAKAFGVAVTDLTARFGAKKRRRMMMMASMPGRRMLLVR